jgi:hypothetical protein
VGVFYSPQGNLPIGGVRDINMSGLGARNVSQHSQESGLDTGHVRCLGLTRVKADRPDISRLGAGHVQFHFVELRIGDG